MFERSKGHDHSRPTLYADCSCFALPKVVEMVLLLAFRWRALGELVGQSVLLGMPVENWTVFTFIIGMTSFAVACRTSR